jgi:hypothetical protein
MKRIKKCVAVRQCAVTFLVGLCLLGSSCAKQHPYIDTDVFERAAAEVFGQRIAELAPGGGSIVVLLRHGGDDQQLLRNEDFLAGLNSVLGEGTYRLMVTGPNLRNIKPSQREAVNQAIRQGWPPRAVVNWCRADRRAVAVVSFLEFPAGIKPSALAELPPLFVFSTTNPDAVQNLVHNGGIRTAIIPRPGDENASFSRRNPSAEEIVTVRYDIVTGTEQ